MIALDRDSPLPVSEQLVDQLRYQIASGRYRPGERLPSTRTLANQLGLSFHTTRKAYQRLASEGLVDVRRGGGFRVRERRALSTAERMERGAAVVQDALQKLVALGLSDEETEFVLEEQRTYAEPPGGRRRLLFAAPFLELAESGAEQLTAVLQERVEAVTLDSLGRHADADVVVTPLPYLREAVVALPRADALGVSVGWPHDVLARVARLGERESVALIVRQADAVDPLTDVIRTSTGFPGTVYPLTTEADRPRLEGLIRRADLVLYTPQVRRRVRPLLGERTAAELTPTLEPDSLTRVRETVGR
jgi:GntR family transcriptional regulator